MDNADTGLAADPSRVFGTESAQTRPRLWYYRVTYTALSGGDWIETPALNEEDAASIAFHRHMCPGFRVTEVEFAWWHPLNRKMMGVITNTSSKKSA